MVIAGDSNDIYILSGEQHSDQPSTPSSLLCAEDNGSGPSSWQTESLPVSLAGHESWAHVAMTDPEDAKSLDSNEGAALAEERSENNSSNSDIVHVEREEAELLEEAGEGGGAMEEPGLQESMMSILGTESDLAELRAEFRDQSPAPLGLSESTTAPVSLVSLEEPVLLEAPEILLTLPSLASSEPEPPLQAHNAAEVAAPHVKSEPAPLAVIAIEPDPEPELLHAADPTLREMAPPSRPSPTVETSTPASTELEPSLEPAPDAEPIEASPQADELQSGVQIVADPEGVPLLAAPLSLEVTEAPVEALSIEPGEQLEPEPEPEPDSEFPVLLFGGALMALAAVATYGALAYRRK